jgi:hypothetical protein
MDDLVKTTILEMKEVSAIKTVEITILTQF